MPAHDIDSASEDEARDKFVHAYNVSRETLLAFERYQALLRKWAKQINLVGPSTLNHFWTRHVLDCAQLLTIISPDAKSLMDIGTGAGLPGLVVGKLLSDRHTDTNLTLVESSAKRCGFLREAARTLEVSVTICQKPIETVTPVDVDVVTARAFAPLEKLLELTHQWTDLGAHLVFLKGEDVQSEIDQASTSWSFRSKITPSLIDSRGCILEISQLRRLSGG